MPDIRELFEISKDFKDGQFVREERNSTPVKLLLQRRRVSKYFRLLKLGTEPVNEFLLSSKRVSMDTLLIELGILPLSVL